MTRLAGEGRDVALILGSTDVAEEMLDHRSYFSASHAILAITRCIPDLLDGKAADSLVREVFVDLGQVDPFRFPLADLAHGTEIIEGRLIHDYPDHQA